MNSIVEVMLIKNGGVGRAGEIKDVIAAEYFPND